MKLTIVINGSGGVGKDTLCKMAEKHFKVRNVSSVTPVKELAKQCGWQGDKSDRSRKFLADLKSLLATYNDYPTIWLSREYEAFLSSTDELMFVHIREPEEIEKFVRVTGGKAKTLLIRGGARTDKQTGQYGNRADDGVEQYRYDYYFTNDKSLAETESLFIAALHGIVDANS